MVGLDRLPNPRTPAAVLHEGPRMATIERYKTKSGVRYRVRYRTPDRRQTDKRGFTTMRDAKAFAATVEVEKMTGAYIAPRAGRTTVAELAEAWLDLKRAQLAASSYPKYEQAWLLHVKPKWGHMSVADITSPAVEAWVATMPRADKREGVAGAVVRIRAHGVLAAILDMAVKLDKLRVNPARGVTLPSRRAKRHVYLTASEVATIAEKAGEHADLVLVLAYCGLRWGEAIGLRAHAVDTTRRRLHITANAVQVGSDIHEGETKDRENRIVPVPQFVAERLGARIEGLAPEALVFPAKSGSHMWQPDSRRGWFARAVRESGVQRVTPHDLRHTCASLAISAGANVKALQRMLGHSSAAMTLDTYADLFDDDLDDLADAMHEAYGGGGTA